MSRPRPHLRPRAALAPLALLLGLLVAGCGAEEPDPVADALARERAAARFAEQSWGGARDALAPLVERDEAAFDDLLRAAAVEFADGRTDACAALLARAERLEPGAPAVRWMRGQLALGEGLDGYPRALEHFRAVVESRPGDLPARLALAQVEIEVGDAERALALYRSVVDVGFANGGAWYAAAVYRLFSRALEVGDDQAAERYERAWRELEAAGVQAPSPLAMQLGELALLRPPEPAGSAVAEPEPLPPFEARPGALERVERALAGATLLEARDLEGDGDPDLLAQLPDGIRWALRAPEGFELLVAHEGPVRAACALDFDNDGDLDLALVDGEGVARLVRFEAQPPSFAPLATPLPPLPGPPDALVAVDFDHEGDVDLLVVGAFGARLWRNDGLDEPDAGGAFHDASEGAGLPADRAFAWGAIEDFDGDNDVDLLLGGPASDLLLLSSLRGGRFAPRDVFPAGTRLAQRPVLADLDGDARVDLWPVGADAPWLQQPGGGFAPPPSGGERPERAPRFLAADLDLDGALDLVGGGASGELGVLLAAGLPQARPSPLAGVEALDAAAPLVAADLDGDRVPDLAASTAQGLRLWSGRARGRARREALRGVRDNRRGLGAVLEYRAGPLYRRIFWRGEPELLGVGAADAIDVLRVTWPNGVVATRLDLGLDENASVSGSDAAFEAFGQSSGQAGSCPFLYAWNGERYVFVSDVLGITPLGLPMAPGLLVPPDHDEYVLVRGEDLVPAQGVLRVQVTEELREVTYLDQARLIAVDHPEGTRVFPDERFTFPPFPEAHVHTVESAHGPSRAMDARGRDWSTELARADGVHAEPFELEAEQYGGLAKPWTLELEFDPELVREASRLRLVLTGWFFWSDASSNMASARHPRVAFVPPTLQVPDPAGEGDAWRDVGPPIGFPAGKTKTMVVDVGAFLSRERPRLRLASTLRLYWDAIELATCGDDAQLVQTAVEPASARLWRRGYSAPLDAGTRYGDLPRSPSTPERFDWDVLADPPRWNPHPGRYTRYGECLELVTELDDCFAILGAGDALELVFPAAALPPLRTGFRRDWLVFLDGWAKDQDPNTLEALEVEPLPFHGMSGYPYGPDERFPDDERHRRWRARWQTREAQPWILPLSPARRRELLAGPR